MNKQDAHPTARPSINRLLDLQKMLVTFATVDRKVYMPPMAETAESDVEHSYSLAMLSWFLAPHFPHLDSSKLVQLCLAHDIVEVYSGDTFSFDTEAVAKQKDLEQAAVIKLKTEWTDFPALLEAVEEYEARSTPEAQFIVALDRFHPLLMDYLCEGRTWHKLDITFDALMNVKDKDLSQSEIAHFYDQLKEILIQNPGLFPRSTNTLT